MNRILVSSQPHIKRKLEKRWPVGGGRQSQEAPDDAELSDNPRAAVNASRRCTDNVHRLPTSDYRPPITVLWPPTILHGTMVQN